MGKLYIFGNGLDKHYHLKTDTKDFVEILKTKQIYNEIYNANEVFEGYGVIWSDFEQNIANIDLEMIEFNQVQAPDYLSDHEYDRVGVITNVEIYLDSLKEAIFDSLSDMVCTAEEDILHIPYDNIWKFEKGDMIISFNYTSTIESVSNVTDIPILHIHGFYNAQQPLILGYKDPLNNYNYQRYSNPEDGDYYLEKQLYLIHEFYQALRKNMQFEKLKEFLNNARGIDEIMVYGHSFGGVDVPYLEMIDKLLQPQSWNVSYYNIDDIVFYNKEQLSFKDKIKLFQW